MLLRDQGGLIGLRPDHSPCTLLVHLFRPETGSCARERCTAISASDTGLHQHMLLFVFFKTQCGHHAARRGRTGVLKRAF